MATRRWSFVGEGGLHVVELHHGWLSGRRTVLLDGQVVLAATNFLDGGSHHELAIDGRPCTLSITCPTGISYRYALRVDGVELEANDARATALPAVGTSVPVPSTPSRAEPRDVSVQSRFVDLWRWFQGDR